MHSAACCGLMLQRLNTPAIACSGSYLPHLLRVLRRLVHPDEQRDGVSNGANVGKLVKISGPGDYYSDEEEEYPYREDSGSECEGEDEEQDADFAAGEEDDQFEDEADIMDEDIEKLHNQMKEMNKPIGEEWLTS